MRRHWQLILLFGIFLTPLLSALYLLGDQSYTFNTVQYGTLIPTPKPLHFTSLYQLDGVQITSLPVNKKWRLVYVTPNDCGHACQQRKHILANLRIALGSNQERLQILTSNQDQIKPNQAADSILLLNPDGLYIMHYAANTNASNIFKDVKRLLKYSHD